MQNVYAVFDTNVYRELTYGLNEHDARKKIDEIKSAELQHRITPGLSVVTAMELLAHLANPDDPSFQLCKVALTSAGHHVMRPENRVSYLPHPQIQLQNLILGDYDEVLALKFEIIMEIVNFLNKGPADEYIVQFHDQIAEVARMVSQHEQDFKETMLTVIKGLDPTVKGWTALINDREKRKRNLKYLNEHEQDVLDLLAMGYVHKKFAARNVRREPVQIAEAAVKVSDFYHTAMRLHLSMMKKFMVGGFDMDNRKANRANTIWDIYHLFSVTDGLVGDREIVFVTGEKWLHEVSIESGLGDKILKLSDYLQAIGTGH